LLDNVFHYTPPFVAELLTEYLPFRQCFFSLSSRVVFLLSCQPSAQTTNSTRLWKEESR
jgi:hypothetical protein